MRQGRCGQSVAGRGAGEGGTGETRSESGAQLPCRRDAPGERRQAFKAALVAGGGSLDFATLLGSKPVVLTFWASWCQPCLREAPQLVALDPRGEALAKYAKGASIPLTFVIDRSGAVTRRHQNFEPGGEAEIEKAIQVVLE